MSFSKKKFLIAIAFALFPMLCFSQEIVNLSNSFSLQNDKDIYFGWQTFSFTSSKPLIKKLNTTSDTGIIYLESKNPKWIKRKFLYEDLLIKDTSDFSIRLNPLFDFSFSKTSTSKNLTKNTRGVLISGNFGKNLYFKTTYNETQANFADYMVDYISKYAVVPGQTRVKDFKSNAYDYGVARGLISWSPKSFLNLTFGHDNVFFGDGYRSLLLSDFSSPYPFLRITSTFRKLQYVALFTSFQNLKEGNIIPDSLKDWNAGYIKKTGTFHYLTWKPISPLQLSFFEGTIWETGTNSYDINLDKFNPIPLFHTIEFGLNSRTNVVCGLNFNYNLTQKFRIYGQAVVDNFSLKQLSEKGYIDNKTGFQIGFKTYNPFSIENFTLQTEYNTVKPYTYSHFSPIQSYTHYNQALAHPMGANFSEMVLISSYRFKRLMAHVKLVRAVYGTDTTNSNFGKDIFSGITPSTGTTGNKTGQGIKTDLNYLELQIIWLLNQKTNMNVFAGLTYRKEKNELLSKKENILFFGIRTSIFNEYNDF